MPKLALCVPWDSPFTFFKFTKSALNLAHPSGWELQWFFGSGWCPARRHADACEQALAWDADLLCILGADQEYPPDMLPRLLQSWQRVGGMIAALVPFRGYVSWQQMAPFQPLAWRLDPGVAGMRVFRGAQQDADMLKLVTPKDGDLQRAHIIGSGVLLFHRDVLLGLKKPWFYESVDPETFHRTADQDTRFVWRMQTEVGVPLHIDTTIRVKHDHVFSIDETFQHRFLDWMDRDEPSRDPVITRFRDELPTIPSADVPEECGEEMPANAQS